MKKLILPVTKGDFEQIKTGQMLEAYRLVNECWGIRLEKEDYDMVVVTLADPSKKVSAQMEFPYNGATRKMVQFDALGLKPCEVYAIPLKGRQMSLF